MSFKFAYFLLFSFVIIANHLTAQKTVEGVKFEKTFQHENDQFILNGAGLREKLWLDLYVAGLYMKNATSSATEIINRDEPMAMRLKIVSSLITGEKMAEATMEGFEKAMNNDITPLEKEINQFINAFKNTEISKGDQCDLIYVPEKGVLFFTNDKLITSVKGYEFKKALFNVWFGPDPVDEDLKESLLKL